MSDKPAEKFSFKKFLSDAQPATDNYDNSQYDKSYSFSSSQDQGDQGDRVDDEGEMRAAEEAGVEADGRAQDVARAAAATDVNDEVAEARALEEFFASENLGKGIEKSLDAELASEMEKFSSYVDSLSDDDVHEPTADEIQGAARAIDEQRQPTEQSVPRAVITDEIMYERKKQTQDILQRVRAATRGEQNNAPAGSTANTEARLDAAARERMMYEGSDREIIARAKAETADNRTETATMKMPINPPKIPARQKVLQKESANRPLTQKRIANRPRLIGICNQKGGVGKTTTAINLATALAAVGKNVLIIDMDPQGNASTGLGVRRSAIRTSVYDVLFEGADVVQAAVTTRVPNLYVVPSSIHLSGAEIELVTAENREYRLKKALHRSLPYDYVIVDCPPSLNLLTLNALVAVDSILVPLQCEFYALEGLSHLVKTIERVKKSFNAKLDIHGVVLTMYDLRNKLSTMVEDDVRGHFGDKVYKTVIPRNVRLSEAPSHGLPAIIYDMKSSGAQAYIKLAREVIQREKQIALAANQRGGDDSAQVA